jgi:hypothetical protein
MGENKIEIILSAQNQAEAGLKAFGAQLDRLIHEVGQLSEAVEKSATQSEQNFDRMGKAAESAGSKAESSFRAISGHASVFSRMGGTLAAVFSSPIGALAGFLSLGIGGLGSLLSMVGRLTEEVARLGLEIVRWLGEQAIAAIEKLTKLLLGLGAILAAVGIAATVMAVKGAAEVETWVSQFTILMKSAQAAREEI